jgi:hypothetical protein
MVVTKCAQHVRVHARHPHPGYRGDAAEPSGGGVAVHAVAIAVEQDRPGRPASGRPVTDGAVDRPTAAAKPWTV